MFKKTDQPKKPQKPKNKLKTLNQEKKTKRTNLKTRKITQSNSILILETKTI
jgi:hypothetical protein